MYVPNAPTQEREPRGRAVLTETLMQSHEGPSARRRTNIWGLHGAPRVWCFGQRQAAVVWHESCALVRVRLVLTDRHSGF